MYGNVSCGVLSIPSISNITIYLHDNAIFNIDLFVHLNEVKNQINIYSEFQTKLNLNYACTFKNSSYLTIKNHIKNNETETNITVRAVEDNGKIEIQAEGIIYEDTYSNFYAEDIKALVINNNSVSISPNLLVKTNAVLANHNATISNIEKNDLFYLESKGLSKESAKKVIKTGFLKGILKLEFLKLGGEGNE